MRSFSYLNTAGRIVENYDGFIPLNAWLKQFFKSEKKYGSSDRKLIANLCYSYYRLGHAFAQCSSLEEKFLIAIFLCSTRENVVLKEQRPAWNEQINSTLDEKLGIVNGFGETEKIFPLNDELSDQVDHLSFNRSFLVQPDLFLRIRPGSMQKVKSQLEEANIPHQQVKEDCLRLSNQSRVDEVIHLDRDAVVQDLNSQEAVDPVFQHLPVSKGNTLSVYDCCAASGGKSILLYDKLPPIKLTVSDIRESIMINLRKRFSNAGINNYHSFIADLSSGNFVIKDRHDLVICDAPCSGSGTWSRTPEQLMFFKPEEIVHYTSLQKRIALNAIKTVKKGGLFLYITCSVFYKENEEIVDHIRGHSDSDVIWSGYHLGYHNKADSLFSALFLAR